MHLRYPLPSSNPNMPLFTKKLMEEKKAERRCGRKGERGVWVCPWSLPLPAVHLSCPRAPPASSKPLSFAISNLYSMFLLGTRVLAHPGAMKLPAGPEEAGWSPESHTVTRPRRVLASGGGRWARVHPCTRVGGSAASSCLRCSNRLLALALSSLLHFPANPIHALGETHRNYLLSILR